MLLHKLLEVVEGVPANSERGLPAPLLPAQDERAADDHGHDRCPQHERRREVPFLQQRIRVEPVIHTLLQQGQQLGFVRLEEAVLLQLDHAGEERLVN